MKGISLSTNAPLWSQWVGILRKENLEVSLKNYDCK